MLLAMIRLPNTFLSLVEEGGWYDLPGKGPTSPARLGDQHADIKLVEVVPAGPPPAGKRYDFGSLPSYVIVAGRAVETYPVEDIPPPSEDDYARAIRSYLDEGARAMRYDSIDTAVSYRGDPNPNYSAEGEAFAAWRSAVWTYAYAEFGKVLMGAREQPSIEQIIGELPPSPFAEV
jgi:hypothetical protein